MTRFGVVLPTAVPTGRDAAERQACVDRLRAFMRRCDELGFDIWCIDHLLAARGLYAHSYLEPMTTLTMAAAVTTNVRIGSSVLVAPLRHPVLLAKAIATLDHLSGGRFTFGVAPGWDAGEFAAMEVPLSERGRRTDEVIEVVRGLLRGDLRPHDGEFYRFADVAIEPRPLRDVPVWVGGGGKVQDGLHSDLPSIAPKVVERILNADGWISRAAGTQEMVLHDLGVIEARFAETGRDPATCTFAHSNFIHLVPGAGREEALRVQLELARAMFGETRSPAQLCESYLFGSVDEQLERLTQLTAAGMDYFILAPLDPGLDQLDLIAEHVVGALGVAQ